METTMIPLWISICGLGLGLLGLVERSPGQLFEDVLADWGMFLVAPVILSLLPLYYFIRYKNAIRARVKEVERRLAQGMIYRDAKGSTPRKKKFHVLELHPSFKDRHPNVMSLGEYLSSLRINHPLDEKKDEASIPNFVEKELQATIGSILLQNLGPRVGAALLPMLGISHVDSWIAKIARTVASYVASHMIAETSQQWDATDDVAAFPFTVSEIAAFANLNQKMRSNSCKKDNETTNEESSGTEPTTTPLEWMNRGEIGYSPSFSDSMKDLLPNPFIVNEHYDSAILGLENRIQEQSSVTATRPAPDSEHVTTTKSYDPEDRSLPEPVPINERVLPGLHMGWGDARCTHTKREILRNRLLGVLLTKLSHNYYLTEKQDKNIFIVVYKGTHCRFPDEIVRELMKDHVVEVCPRSTITTFGMAACVKEEDDSWTSIPVAFFLRTGYERRDGKPAYFSAPHGGLDLSITSGPLLGDGGKLDIQFYVAIDGLCAWHSNHNVAVPWLQPVSTTEVYDREQILGAVRMAGLVGVTFNSLATEMHLPFGGYGVLGVCNDSAAVIDFALRGETNMYPLFSTGRYLFHSGRRLLELKESFLGEPDLNEASEDLRRLLKAVANLDSDIHNSPSQLIGATGRYLVNNPTSYFQLTEDSIVVMKSVAKLYEEYANSQSVPTESRCHKDL